MLLTKCVHAIDMDRVIYDFGANNGDDIPYYLLRAKRVVAVEANPELCKIIRNRFSKEIELGRVFVENHVLSVDSENVQVPFYIHKHNHVLSQFPEPSEDIKAQFEAVLLTSVNPVELMNRYGEPYYLKIDLESYDQVVLEHLFKNQIYPEYLSSEAHSPEVLDLLCNQGSYRAFKLVDGHNVHEKYKCRSYKVYGEESCQSYSFPEHSAGPFGEDIDGDWIGAETMRARLGFRGFGWKDIHVTRNLEAQGVNHSRLREFVLFATEAILRLLREMAEGKMSFRQLVKLVRKRLAVR